MFAALLVATTAFQLPHGSLVRTSPKPGLVGQARVDGLTVLRGGAAPSMGMPQVAAAMNCATFSFYGLAMLFKPAELLKTVMRSTASMQFADMPYAITQYLGEPAAAAASPCSPATPHPSHRILYLNVLASHTGAFYLSQGLRMLRALGTPSMLKYDLQGVVVIQSLLCLVSLGRLAAGIAKDSVTLSLPVGQALMAGLAYAGYLKA